MDSKKKKIIIICACIAAVVGVLLWIFFFSSSTGSAVELRASVAGPVYLGSQQQIVDTFLYSQVKKGETYTLEAQLCTEDGQPYLQDSQEYSLVREFTPDETDGEIDLVFEVDSLSWGDLDSLYVFSVLYDSKGNIVAEIQNTANASQEVNIIHPEGGLSLVAKVNPNDETIIDETVDIIGTSSTSNTQDLATASPEATALSTDSTNVKANGVNEFEYTFTYSGFAPGSEYRIVGELVTADTKESVVNLVDQFTLAKDSTSGVFTITFEVDTSVLSGKTLLPQVKVYDHTVDIDVLKENFTLVEQHRQEGEEESATASPTSTTQIAEDEISVTDVNITQVDGIDAYLPYFELLGSIGVSVENTPPELVTSLSVKDAEPIVNDAGVEEWVVDAVEDITLLDSIKYTHITPNQAYKLETVIIDANTGSAVGSPLTREVTLPAVTGEMLVEIPLDARSLGGITLTVFEKLCDAQGIPLAEYNEVNFNNVIRVRGLGVSSSVTGPYGSNRVFTGGSNLTVHINYDGLQVGREYVAKNDFYNGSNIVATQDIPFTPSESDSSFENTFTIDLPEGELGMVTSLYSGDTQVATEDNSNIPQERKISVALNGVGGVAQFSTGTKQIVSGTAAQLVDTVTFKGLQPGQGYVVIAMVMNGVTGEAVKDSSGRNVGTQMYFVPQGTTGTFDIAVAQAGSQVGTYVVYLQIDDAAGNTVCTYQNLNDTAQRVEITNGDLIIANQPFEGITNYMPEETVDDTNIEILG